MSEGSETEWRDQLLRGRREKDAFFRSRDSPIAPHERAQFRGLPYFEPDRRYRFELDLDEASPETVVIPRTGGDEVRYERAGTFSFATPDGSAKLSAFRTEDSDPGELFVLFRDATSAKETYGGGRYLEAHALEDGRWLVDFNAAYHPFCVYNEAYTCPIPPRENWLKVAIRAGERLPG